MPENNPQVDAQLEQGASPDLVMVLQSLTPGAQWVLRGSEYTGLEWLDEKQTKPTESEIADEKTRLTARKDDLAYRGKRADEYPSIEEQLDMQYHDKVNDTTTWKDAVKAVKDKYPKP